MFFKNVGGGGGEGREALTFVFHTYNFAIIFTEDFTGVIFLSFFTGENCIKFSVEENQKISREDILFHGKKRTLL